MALTHQWLVLHFSPATSESQGMRVVVVDTVIGDASEDYVDGIDLSQVMTDLGNPDLFAILPSCILPDASNDPRVLVLIPGANGAIVRAYVPDTAVEVTGSDLGDGDHLRTILVVGK